MDSLDLPLHCALPPAAWKMKFDSALTEISARQLLWEHWDAARGAVDELLWAGHCLEGKWPSPLELCAGWEQKKALRQIFVMRIFTPDTDAAISSQILPSLQLGIRPPSAARAARALSSFG